MTIGDLISIRRKELGLTLEEVGRAVGVSKSTVKKWESGFIVNMRRDKIPLIAKALQISPSTLIGEDKNLEATLKNHEEIGERIKRFRQARNMSQAELAKAIGASADTIRYYEHGDVGNLRLERLMDIAYELNVLPEELLTDDQSELERVYKEALNNYYDELNHAGKKEIVERAYELTQIPKYTNPDDSPEEETTQK
jgi:transcriptional regulator with XRE-family HTH domain